MGNISNCGIYGNGHFIFIIFIKFIFGVRYTPKALLSNCSGFVLNNGKIVIALPGSPLAVRDYIHLLGGLIKHALDMAKGKGHENNN